MTPREEMTVWLWETGRRAAALLTSDAEGTAPALVRPLLAGLALAGVLITIVHMH